jgi:hypothetical protein
LKHLKLHNPFVLISIFFLLFIYLRYFFIVYDWSGLIAADNKYVGLTILIYLLIHIGLGVLILIAKGFRWKSNIKVNSFTLPIVKLYLWIGIVSLVFLAGIQFKNHGTFGWFVPVGTNMFESLYVLQIPVNFVQVIIIHFIFESKSKIRRNLLTLLLLLIIFIMASRGAIMVLFIYALFYASVFNKTINKTKVILFLTVVFPITITFLTFLKFRDQNVYESLSLTLSMLIDKEFWVWLFSVAYGRYYILEASILMLERLQEFNNFKHNFFPYLFDNFLPSFINPDKISITRYNCLIISPGRWEETTSCSISLPFFLYLDSQLLGIIYFIVITFMLLYFWKLLNNTKHLFLKLVFVFLLAQFMFFVNWDIASINYLLYQFLFFCPAFLILISSIKSKAKVK